MWAVILQNGNIINVEADTLEIVDCEQSKTLVYSLSSDGVVVFAGHEAHVQCAVNMDNYVFEKDKKPEVQE